LYPDTASLIIANIGQLVSLRSSVSGSRAGKYQSELSIIKRGAVAVSGNLILEVGQEKELFRRVKKDVKTRIIDACGRVVTPGLVDSHTHLVFAGNRANEFEMRIQGKNYQQIAQAGGGIRATVKALRKASKKELIESSWKKLNRMVECGTTTVEIKSGYGLSLKDEIKTLEVVRELRRKYPKASVAPTFLGAHAVPEKFQGKRKEYVKYVCQKMIPEVAKRRLAEFCDVFCEKSYFSPEESRKILETGRKFGLKPKIHADEFASSGGSEVAAEVKAISADHLMFATAQNIDKMRKAGVVAVLLPGTSFFVGSKRYAPARMMIEKGLPVALATDFNPGSNMSESLPITMTIACLQLKMTPAQVLTAATINAAYALDRGQEIGSLEPDKKADLVLWELKDYREIPYHYGVNLVDTVIKDGITAYQRKI
jgi:imidazolonepropionase